ncbi:MAG: Non-ribosomal peptide synthetase component [Pedosphaera sp.]|nr:Non-ribosomal peptide synthetase component [Pedosphaera sp.]
MERVQARDPARAVARVADVPSRNKIMNATAKMGSDQRLRLLDCLLDEEGLGATPTTRAIPRRQNPAEHPISYAQKRLWFLNRLEPGPHYNDHFNLRLQGPLHIPALQHSLDEIVRRHEALRATFHSEHGEAIQTIAPPFSVPLPLTDLGSLPESERMPRATQLAVETVRATFDLERGPLLRARLLRFDSLDHLLVLAVHHIAIDGWSRGVFLGELTALYNAFVAGLPSPLPPLPIQYADFASWQQDWMRDEILAGQLAYWKQQLAGAPALLEWPATFPRPAIQTLRGARESFSIPKNVTDALKALSQREGCTVFMTLLAAFQTLASRYTGRHDIVVGSPIANRNHAETEGLIGCFVNTLVLRADLSGNPPFLKVLARVKDMALAAYAHQDLPFEKLVEELHPARNPAYGPVFQVMFVFQNAPAAVSKIANLSISPSELDSGISKFDLTMNLAETSDGLSGWIEYATDLFDRNNIVRMLGHYQTLLEGIVENPARPISVLPIVTAPERHQLLLDWNATNTDYPRSSCVHELFEAQAAQTPDSVAVVCGDQELTYAELNARANQLARHLRGLGVRPDTRVGISVERSLEMTVGILGILKAGGAYVPLDPAYPLERLTFMLEDSKIPVLLTQQSLAEKLVTVGPRVIYLDTDWQKIARENPANLIPAPHPENLIYIIYTSGSTGRPKATGVYHLGFTNLAHWYVTEYAVSASDRFLMVGSLSFDLTQKVILGPLIRGAQLHILPPGPYDPSLIRRLIRENQITMITCTPGTFYPLVDPPTPSALKDVASLRCLTFGGEPISIPRLRPWLESETCHVLLGNNYGPTECSDICASYTMTRANMDQYPFVPVGKPIYNARLLIVNEAMQLCPVGVSGELCIGGEGVGAGYLNDPVLTASKFIHNTFPEIPGRQLYKTGDLCRFLPDGNIEFLGRIDHQVKIRGFRIELREVESALASHPAIGQALVTVHHPAGPDRGSSSPSPSPIPPEPSLVAYFVARNGCATDTAELRRFLKDKLPDYMVPSAFVSLEKFPLSPNGKVDRKALPAPESQPAAVTSHYAAPGNATEKMLVDIWAAMLRLDRVGIHDNFFDLGGHSLLIAQLHAQICEAFKTELPIVKLFQYPTISSLASHLDRSPDEFDSMQKIYERAKLQKAALGRQRPLEKKELYAR